MGVIFATLNAIAQIGLVTAFPLWSILVIALDVIVIYQLTARWVPGSVLDDTRPASVSTPRSCSSVSSRSVSSGSARGRVGTEDRLLWA
jgi:hypothetical protein